MFTHYEFEFASGCRMLLTASINGTSKALMTTDNIELGVLRSMPLMPPPIQWKKADEPTFEPLLRLGWGFAVPEIIYAGFLYRQTGSLFLVLLSSIRKAVFPLVIRRLNPPWFAHPGQRPYPLARAPEGPCS